MHKIRLTQLVNHGYPSWVGRHQNLGRGGEHAARCRIAYWHTRLPFSPCWSAHALAAEHHRASDLQRLGGAPCSVARSSLLHSVRRYCGLRIMAVLYLLSALAIASMAPDPMAATSALGWSAFTGNNQTNLASTFADKLQKPSFLGMAVNGSTRDSAQEAGRVAEWALQGLWKHRRRVREDKHTRREFFTCFHDCRVRMLRSGGVRVFPFIVRENIQLLDL